jgi:hypothetical protein
MSESPDEPTFDDGAGDDAHPAEIPMTSDSQSEVFELSSTIGDTDNAESSTDAPERRQRRVLIGVGVIIVLALVGGVLAAVIGSPPNADAAVISAVDHAIGDKTALVSMNENVNAAGKSISFTGTGAFNFSQSALQVDLGGSVNGQTVDVDGIYLGGVVYENIAGISQFAPGKSWLSLNLSSLVKSTSSSSTSGLGNDPLAALSELGQQGATVVDLGPSTVDGQSVEGYSVTFSPATIQSEIQKAKLPSWMRTAMSTIAVNSTSEKVFINGDSLVQISIATSVNSSTAGTVTESESLDFSDYGTPVTITAPAANQVIPFSQFLKLAAAADSSSND